MYDIKRNMNTNTHSNYFLGIAHSQRTIVLPRSYSFIVQVILSHLFLNTMKVSWVQSCFGPHWLSLCEKTKKKKKDIKFLFELFLSSWLLCHKQQMDGNTVVCFTYCRSYAPSVTGTSRFFFSGTGRRTGNDKRFMTWHHVMHDSNLTWRMLIRFLPVIATGHQKRSSENRLSYDCFYCYACITDLICHVRKRFGHTLI